jgi:hypothetical protein
VARMFDVTLSRSMPLLIGLMCPLSSGLIDHPDRHLLVSHVRIARTVNTCAFATFAPQCGNARMPMLNGSANMNHGSVFIAYGS